jgi:hypothetical protein
MARADEELYRAKRGSHELREMRRGPARVAIGRGVVQPSMPLI